MNRNIPHSRCPVGIALAVMLGMLNPLRVNAGVTIITHGLNGDVNGWVTGMATNLPNHSGFPGTNFSCYTMAFIPAGGGSFTLNATRVAGDAPSNSSSGEIIIKLDWSDLADGNSYNTYQVASAVTPALLSTNFISELGGHALVEFSLHLIGHSRGGSLFSEVSQRLGTNGVWIDHLTTLDPHPLNNDGFNLDWLSGNTAVDAPVRTYENVLFHDNYWQHLAFLVYGEPVSGAYVRQLYNLDGGYHNTSSATPDHSNTHLWYHGTVDERNPANDTEALITSAEFSSWYVPYEQSSHNAGFKYSLIGRGDRTSTDQPVGPGYPMIRDGYNQWWDLGAGGANNRTALPANNGAWPNLIKFNRLTTNQVAQGQTMPVKFYYQWAQPNTSLATISIYLDADHNPLNTNQTLLEQIVVPGNGAGFVSYSTTNLMLTASNAVPGSYAVLATISDGGNTRLLYAPEQVEVIAPREPPLLDITKLNDTQYLIGVNAPPGQTVILQDSPDLVSWNSIATNTLSAARWDYTNAPTGNPAMRYYRALLP